MKAKDIIALGLKKGFSEVEIFSVRDKTLELTVFNNRVDDFTKSDVTVVKVKGIYDHKLVSGSTENLSLKSFNQLFDDLIEDAKAITVVEPAIIFEGSKEYPVIKENKFDFDSVSVESKIEYLKNLESTILKHPNTKQVQTAYYNENFGETTIINSKGLNLTRRHNFAYAYAIGVFEKDGDIKTGYDIKLIKRFDELNADDDAKTTIKSGIDKLGGSSLPTGSYPCVFSSKQFSSILAVFSSLFSGEMCYRNMTALKDKVGQKIAVDSFNLLDDPLNDLAPFQNSFDDEGVACMPKKIIENGVFTGFLHSLKTAALFNAEPTGNAFGGGIRPGALYLAPGEESFDQLISGIKQGLYITELMALHAGVNTSSGDFSLQAAGVLIEDGKLSTPVKMIVVSGNYFEMLKQIKGIANDLVFEVSGIGSPSVYVGDLSVSGEESQE